MRTIRQIKKDDIHALKGVIDSNQLFPADLLDGMVGDFFNNPDTKDIWLTTEHAGKLISVAYCAPERLTEGTYNLYLIAILRESQGQGIGAEMMHYIEHLLKRKGNRILIVETSGLPEFELTRKFYHKLRYQREAVIREFYQEGEDKIVFWKKL